METARLSLKTRAPARVAHKKSREDWVKSAASTLVNVSCSASTIPESRRSNAPSIERAKGEASSVFASLRSKPQLQIDGPRLCQESMTQQFGQTKTSDTMWSAHEQINRFDHFRRR